jgi:hypothetical protein
VCAKRWEAKREPCGAHGVVESTVLRGLGVLVCTRDYAVRDIDNAEVAALVDELLA